MSKFLAALALSAPLACSTAFAKGHDQGSTDEPGRNVKAETVEAAKGLGANRGNSGNTPAAEKRKAKPKK